MNFRKFPVNLPAEQLSEVTASFFVQTGHKGESELRGFSGKSVGLHVRWSILLQGRCLYMPTETQN
jgi:hypothetical protein